MQTCHTPPTNKKEYLTDIGKILVEENGKKKYYKPEEVKKAHRQSDWSGVVDFSCFAMSVFCEHRDFDSFHRAIGESCNYVEMRLDMLSGISLNDTNVGSLDLFADIDTDASWLDFGDTFDGVFEGIGDFFGGILDIFDGLS